MVWARASKTVLVLGVALTLGAYVTGCSDSTASSSAADLNGTWQLASFVDAEGELVDADTAIESVLTLEDGSSTGVGGVNTFTGSYEAGDDGTIEFGPQASTLMAGPDDAMMQEDGLYRALDTAAAFAIDGDTLTLEDAEGETLATFTAVGE